MEQACGARATHNSVAVCFIFFVLIAHNLHAHAAQRPATSVEIVKQWKLFTYNFSKNAPVTDLNYYNPLNVVATSMIVSRDRIFIATPKLFSGVPATVSFVPKLGLSQSPVLQAYPNWSYTVSGRKNFKCSDPLLVSVYRLRIDSCNRLWVLDAGVSRSFDDSEQTCPPKLLVFDLRNDQLVKRIDLPADVMRNQSLFTNLIIDETTSTSNTCDDVFIYMADTTKPAIVVYDAGRDHIWRLSHPAMFPDPDFSQLRILKERFVVMDGVIGLGFDQASGTLYFQPLATDRVFAVSREVLRAGPLRQHDILPVQFVGRKSSQGLALYVSPRDGALVFSPLSETVIAAWQPRTHKQTVLAFDAATLQFVAEMSDSQWEPNTIYALSSRFQRFLLKTVNPEEIHARLIRIKYPLGRETTRPTTLTPVYFHDAALSGVDLGSHLQHLLATRENATNYESSSRVLPTANYAYKRGGASVTKVALSTSGQRYKTDGSTTVGYQYGVGQSGI